MTKLSDHFTLAELTVSSKADQMGIANTPTAEHLENLKHTAAGLEKVRSILGDCAVVVTSGYRNPTVNAAVGGVKNSAHALGHAADFRAAGFSAFAAAAKIRDAQKAGQIEFDQLILESSRRIVHISFDPNRKRNQVLTQAGGPGSPVQKGLHA
jgi:zinc D-Ala-D-Ala carboxypeptidase